MKDIVVLNQATAKMMGRGNARREQNRTPSEKKKKKGRLILSSY